MFIKLFKSTYSLQLIILFAVAILLWMKSFIAPVQATHEYTPAPFYNYLYYSLRNIPLLQITIAFILMIVEAFLLNKILINNALVRKNTLLPAFVYVILMSQNPELHTLYPALLSNLLMIIVLYYLFYLYNETEAYVQILNAGFLIGVASLFYLPAIIFIVILWLGLFIFSIITWREWIISVVGLLIPYLFLSVFYFWFDRLEVMMNNYLEFFVNIGEFSFVMSIYQIITLTIIALILLLAFNHIITSINAKTISIRKRSIILIWFFLISLLTTVYAAKPTINYLALTFIPAAALISIYSLEIKKKIVIEIMFILLILLIIIIRFVEYA